MNNVERTAAPAVGACVGYFLAYWATANYGWLAEQNLAETVAFAGGACTYLANELRGFFGWVARIVESRWG